MTIEEKYNKMMNLYKDVKLHVKCSDSHLYERWKAGGFIVDDDIYSFYPNLGQVVEILTKDFLCV